MPKPHKKKSPRATVTTVNHNQANHALAGSVERREALCWAALQLRIDGWDMTAIGVELARVYKLVDVPSRQAVDKWVSDALVMHSASTKDEAREYIAISMERTEKLMRRFLPIALGQVQIARTVIIDGQAVEVIDEETTSDMARAAKVVHNNMQVMFRALGIGKPTEEEEKGKNLSEKHITALVYQVTQNVVINGDKMPDLQREKVLELRSGSDVVDALDTR